MFIPDPDPGFRFFTHPESMGQKGTGSRIRSTGLFTIFRHMQYTVMKAKKVGKK
jgi:hypothetical protein